MFSRIAVAGTGAIGALMGSYLTKAGYDVTMLSVARPEQAALLNELGLTMEGCGDTFHTPIQAAYAPDLPEGTRFDLIFLTMKSNQLIQAMPVLSAHLAPGGVFVPMENGINDDLLAQFVPQEQIVTCVTFAGGAQLAPGRYMNHDGEFFVGSRSGALSPQVEAVARIAGSVRRTTAVDNIRSLQWDKLGRVCLSVPTATVSGLFLGDVFTHPDTQRFFACLALELFDVALADGCPRETIEERTRAEWLEIKTGAKTGLERAGEFQAWPPGIVDAYTSDIRKGLPLEIDYTNGRVVALGKRRGVPTPANEALLAAVHDIARGTRTASLTLLRELTAKLLK